MQAQATVIFPGLLREESAPATIASATPQCLVLKTLADLERGSDIQVEVEGGMVAGFVAQLAGDCVTVQIDRVLPVVPPIATLFVHLNADAAFGKAEIPSRATSVAENEAPVTVARAMRLV